MDFEPLLALRRELNEKYATLMEGPATVAGMIIWGMAQHRFFRNGKMLFPVDTDLEGRNPAERELSLVFIRAGRYFDRNNPLSWFINFQKSSTAACGAPGAVKARATSCWSSIR